MTITFFILINFPCHYAQHIFIWGGWVLRGHERHIWLSSGRVPFMDCIYSTICRPMLMYINLHMLCYLLYYINPHMHLWSNEFPHLESEDKLDLNQTLGYLTVITLNKWTWKKTFKFLSVIFNSGLFMVAPVNFLLYSLAHGNNKNLIMLRLKQKIPLQN